jgi:hypothetical protein
MTQTEFKLKVSNDILDVTGRDFKVIQHKVGEVLTVDEATFNSLVKGEIITRYTTEGLIRFDKYNFENEVEAETVTVTITRSTRKLKQNSTTKALNDIVK